MSIIPIPGMKVVGKYGTEGAVWAGKGLGKLLGKSKTLFDEFNVVPGKGLNLDIPSALNGRSYITYVFKNLSDEVEYVGRASGKGTPNDVMKQRIAKGHDHFHAGLIPEIIDVQKSKLVSRGAEEFFIQGFIEQGAKLTNIEQALSYYPKDRLAKSMNKLEAFFEELFTR